MPLVLLVLCAWLIVAAFALLLCVAARRTDKEIASADLAPVIELKAAALSDHKQYVA